MRVSPSNDGVVRSEQRFLSRWVGRRRRRHRQNTDE